MKWYSKEVKENYEMVMRLLSKTLLSKYPDAKYVGTTPESFNNLFNPNRETWEVPKLDLVICMDFISNTYNIEHNQNIGIDLTNMLFLIITSVIPDTNIFEHHKMIFSDKFLFNTEEHCEGLVPYVTK
jgi:indole-3-glycerol phosphate synthase